MISIIFPIIFQKNEPDPISDHLAFQKNEPDPISDHFTFQKNWSGSFTPVKKNEPDQIANRKKMSQKWARSWSEPDCDREFQTLDSFDYW